MDEIKPKKYTGEELWGTYEGRRIKLKDLENSHLANLIVHVQRYSGYNPGLLIYLKKLAKKRKLTTKYLSDQQKPFQNDQGDWMIWSFKENKPIKVG